MKIAVTGGSGFLGSHAVAALHRAGHELRLLVRSRDKAERVLARHGIALPEVVVGDIVDGDAVRGTLEGCDAVLQAAASVFGDAAAMQANVAGARNVLGTAVDLGLDPVLYISSVAVMFPPPGPVITVDAPVAARGTAYGISKAACETYARELQARGAPVVIVYPAAVGGPDDPGPTEGTKGLRDRLRYGWARTTGGLSWVDVRDIGAIIVACMEKGRGPRRYLAGGHFVPWMEEADICERLTGRKVRRVPAPPPLVHAVGHIVDFIKWLRPSFDYPLTSEAAQFVTRGVPCDSSATTRELGVVFRPGEEILRDQIRSMYANGQLDARYAGKLAR